MQIDKSIEYEIKNLITEEKYLEILDKLTWSESIKQINYYYDNNEFFYLKNNVTLRIRYIGNKYLFQAKKKYDKYNEEYELVMDDVPNCLKMDLSFLELPNVHQEDLFLMGNMITFRRISKFNDMIVCLDKCEYKGLVDYELEVEYTKNNKLAALKFYMEITRDKKIEMIGKNKRFFKLLLEGK